MEGSIAIHHGSLDKDERKFVEEGVKNGTIKWVICTSSLDLGVDFQPVEQIVQIGSAKNLARLIQRAGRSAHKPGGKSKIIFMPTNSLELLEVSAMRKLLKKNISEKVKIPELSIDVLLQHLVSLACGPGFNPIKEKEEIKNCLSYKELKDEDWDWCINFLEYGGKCLKAYPKYKKIKKCLSEKINNDFKYFVLDKSIIRMHKFNIGTITSDKYVVVKYQRGKTLGTLEENFASKLKKGDTFFFTGKVLEYIKLKDMTLLVKRSNKKSSFVPAWIGGQIAISDLLSKSLRKEISLCNNLFSSKSLINKELNALSPILEKQANLSIIPTEKQLLIELFTTKDYKTLFVFTLEGKFVNEGIAFLWAMRFAEINKNTFSIAVNDFGFSLTTSKDYDFSIVKSQISRFLNTNNLDRDLKSALNFSELSKKRFRQIAQISGLVNNNNPLRAKSFSQLQVSSNLLFDVFTKYENNHLLIKQASREVIEYQLENERIFSCLKRLSSLEVILNEIKSPTPFSFPLLVERLRNTLSNESLDLRIEKLIKTYNK